MPPTIPTIKTSIALLIIDVYAVAISEAVTPDADDNIVSLLILFKKKSLPADRLF